ncbi:NUDIX hydrolase [Deinococcus sp. UYEF24]
MGIQKFATVDEARDFAAAYTFREKAVAYVVRGEELLVFDHVPDDSGVQVPAGGVESGEIPADAAVRELWEESGLRLGAPRFLSAYEWLRPPPRRSQVCYAYVFTAPVETADAWTHFADEHLFAFRWVPLFSPGLASPGLDWEMDAALPELIQLLQESK